ncbi:MAG: T9SS type A sorting domain-containing protein, partial [Ferruginibacter sp.]|nr:T9SS type A sorting domain-containing protein [Ferruginibacter sp.]
PQTPGLSVSPSTITVGQTADFTFVIANLGGGDPSDNNPTNGVQVVLSFPSDSTGKTPTFYKFKSFINPVPSSLKTAAGHVFDWSYDSVNNVIYGINRSPFYNFTADTVVVRVTGIAVTTQSNGAVSGLNISVIYGDNNSSNDNGSAPLIVTRLLAVALTDITASATDCLAKLSWNTLKEDAGSTFDVEYSPDGVSFVKVGTVIGRSATGAKYEYAYSQGNGKGYYRLKIGSATGGISYSKVVNVTTKCNQKKVFIYPNPVQNAQNLQINVSNFAGKIKGDMINAAGQVVLNKTLVNGLNVVKIANLAEGIYTLKVTDEAKEIQNFKIVIVK